MQFKDKSPKRIQKRDPFAILRTADEAEARAKLLSEQQAMEEVERQRLAESRREERKALTLAKREAKKAERARIKALAEARKFPLSPDNGRFIPHGERVELSDLWIEGEGDSTHEEFGGMADLFIEEDFAESLDSLIPLPREDRRFTPESARAYLESTRYRGNYFERDRDQGLWESELDQALPKLQAEAPELFKNGLRTRKEFLGRRFGRLIAYEIETKARAKDKGLLIRCHCDCGSNTVISLTNLFRLKVPMCGGCRNDRYERNARKRESAALAQTPEAKAASIARKARSLKMQSAFDSALNSTHSISTWIDTHKPT